MTIKNKINSEQIKVSTSIKLEVKNIQICTSSFPINWPSLVSTARPPIILWRGSDLINLRTNTIQINISPKHFQSATTDHIRPHLWRTYMPGLIDVLIAVINTLFILQVKERPTTSNLITLPKLLMLSIWFNVTCLIYNILEKLNVASKTVLMNTDDLYSTLLVITSILQFQNTF